MPGHDIHSPSPWPMRLGIALAAAALVALRDLVGNAPLFMVLLLLAGLAGLTALAHFGLARKAMLFGLGFSLVINPNKFFIHGDIFYDFGGVPEYFVSMIDIMTVCLLAWSLWRRRRDRLRFTRPGPWLCLALFGWFAGMVGSVVNAPDTWLVWTQLSFEAKLLLLFLVFGYTLDADPSDEPLGLIAPALYGLALAVGFETLAVLAEYAGLLPSDFSILGVQIGGFHEALDGLEAARVGGTYRHPNYLAPAMAAAMLPLTAAAMTLRGTQRLVSMLAALGGATCLVLTLSRGGWVGGVAGAAVCVALIALSPASLAFVRGNRRLLIALCLAGVGLSVVYGPMIARKLFHSDPMNVEARLELNRMAMEMIADHPLLGVGLNNQTVVGSDYGFDEYYQAETGIPPVVHNIYLLLASEIGLPATICFFAAILMILWGAARAMREADARQGILLAAFAGGIVVFLTADLFGPGLRKPELSYQLWWFLAVVTLLSRRLRQGKA